MCKTRIALGGFEVCAASGGDVRISSDEIGANLRADALHDSNGHKNPSSTVPSTRVPYCIGHWVVVSMGTNGYKPSLMLGKASVVGPLASKTCRTQD